MGGGFRGTLYFVQELAMVVEWKEKVEACMHVYETQNQVRQSDPRTKRIDR